METLKAVDAQYFNGSYWSDVTPFEIVRVISDKTIEVRQMDYEGGKDGLEMGHQSWVISSNPNQPTTRIRLTKKGWRSSEGMRFWPTASPQRYYDWTL